MVDAARPESDINAPIALKPILFIGPIFEIGRQSEREARTALKLPQP